MTIKKASAANPTRTILDELFDRPMFRAKGPRARLLLVALLCLSGLLTGCTTPADPEVEYKPVLLPVKFTLDQNGIGIKGEKEIVTPIGVFSIGAKYSLPENDPETIYVIIRNRNEGQTGFDHTYRVHTGDGEFSAVVNGKTVIQVRNRQVLIDVTDGSISDIQFKTAEPAVMTESSNVVTGLSANGTATGTVRSTNPSGCSPGHTMTQPSQTGTGLVLSGFCSGCC